MSEHGIDADVVALNPREIPNPAHSWETAKRSIRNACPATEHDWVKLIDLNEPAYWRECRQCGLTDVTAAALGQEVETLNVGQRET